jgi:caa(3)-type oxidase subunit IV
MSETPETPESHVTESKPAGAETGVTPEPHHGSLLSHHDSVQGSGDHAGPSVKTYLVIFGALSIFTLVSFVANYFAHPEVAVISKFTSFAIILSVAVCKATLVGMYFMHLILDWGKVFIMIVPALILGPLLMIVLMPDIVLAWKHIVTP